MPPDERQITTRQHVLARSVLRRFLGIGGRLQVLDLGSGAVGRHGLDAEPFVVNRGWDQRSEASTMGAIERSFGMVAKAVLRDGVLPNKAGVQEAVSAMYSLWRIRHHRAMNPLPDVKLNMVRTERSVSDDVSDQGEHFGIITLTSDGRLPGRMQAGPLIQLALDRQAKVMSGKRWGIVLAREGEFVLPDTFGDYMIMPLSPTHCLVADEDDGSLNMEGVMHLNAKARACAQRYLAARDFAACPGIDMGGSPPTG